MRWVSMDTIEDISEITCVVHSKLVAGNGGQKSTPLCNACCQHSY